MVCCVCVLCGSTAARGTSVLLCGLWLYRGQHGACSPVLLPPPRLHARTTHYARARQAGTFVSFDCVASVKGGKPAGSERDCRNSQGVFCTQDEPCTPCTAGGCTACPADTPSAGQCYFTAGLGPYCLVDGTAVACTKCCS